MGDYTFLLLIIIAGLFPVGMKLQKSLRLVTELPKEPAMIIEDRPTIVLPLPYQPIQPTNYHPLGWFYYLCTHTVHTLILGETGKGKTTMARALIAFLSQHNTIVLIDPKNKGNPDNPSLSLSWGVPNKYIVGHGFKGAMPWIAATLDSLNTELEDRLERLANGEPVGDHIYIFIDEWWTIAHHPECKAIAGTFMAQMAVLAREAKMHLVIMAHGKTLESLGLKDGQSEIRENFTFVKLGKMAHSAVPDSQGISHPIVIEVDEDNRLIPQQDSMLLPQLALHAVNEKAFYIPVPKQTDYDPETSVKQPEEIRETSIELVEDSPEVYAVIAALIHAGLIKQTIAIETAFGVSAGGGKYQKHNERVKSELRKLRGE